MAYFTKNDLDQYVADKNRYQAHSGSIYFMQRVEQYNMQAINLHKVLSDGSTSCERLIGSGSSRQTMLEADRGFSFYHGYRDHHKKATRQQARIMLEAGGIRIDHINAYDLYLSADQVELLITWARLTGYSRRAGMADLVYARYFYNNLLKLEAVT